MDPVTTTAISPDGSTVTPPTTPVPDAAPPAAASTAPDPEALVKTSGKVITMPTSAMAKIKQQERERGRRLALKENDETAKRMGYKDFADMKQNGKRQRNDQPAPARTAPAPTNTPAPAQSRQGRTNDQRIQQMQEERKKALRGRAQTEKRLRQLEHEKLAQEAEWELKLAAVKCGVRDVDYAVALIKRATVNMTTEQLDQFDENDYFAKTLRQSHPYLYGEHVVPAHTSTEQQSDDAAPPPPKAATATKPGEKPGVVDANKLTKEEFDALLRKQGLSGALSGASPS